MTTPNLVPASKKYIDFEKLIPLLRSVQLEVPINQQPTDKYFPDFLQQQLTGFIQYYFDKILKYADGAVSYTDGQDNVVLNRATELSNGLIKSVNSYYRGNVLESTQVFNETLDSIRYNTISTVIKTEIATGTNFYRTRPGTSTPFSKEDLFHNPFQNRHQVKTSRYSIPGFPALYLGSSVYVCWEEYNRPDMKKYFFSRFSNTHPLKVARLQRIDDFIKVLEAKGSDEKLKSLMLLRYLSFFPLVIACTIRTKDKDGIFKPEYIIPQLLLQYISSSKGADVDGIMFPSSKVDYKRTNVSAYNYVFPVKTNRTEGYCTRLMDMFELTQPTSIELEELRNHFRNTDVVDASHTPSGDIMIVEDVMDSYRFTALGHLEETLNSRKASRLSTSLEASDLFELDLDTEPPLEQ